MYTIVERRKVNAERLPETMERAQTDFFPKLQQSPGFISFYVVADEPNNSNVAIIVWESKAHADAFEEEGIYSSWMRTLEEFGHSMLSKNRGETVITIEAQQ